MYKLVRSEKEFQLVHDKNRQFKPLLSPRDIAPTIPSSIWRNCTPTEKENWESFIRGGRVTPGTVANPILESWNRCLRAEVEFAGGRCQDILSPRELEKRQDQLLEVASPLIETLCHFLLGFGLVIVLTDHEGYILKTVGALDALRQAEKLNFGPGANWSELSVGTNAIGTALALEQAIQVTGPEHYNDGHHLWTCAAVPLKDPQGRLMGCLDISGPRENARLNILDMSFSTAGLIEERLRLERAHETSQRINRIMSTAVDSISDAIISVNARGVVDGVNASASDLFGLERRRLLGQRLDQSLPLEMVSRLARIKPDGVGKVLSLPTRSGWVRLKVSIQAMPDDFGAGSVITLTKIEEPASDLPQPQPRGHFGHRTQYTIDDIIGKSLDIQRAVDQAGSVAQSDSTVLLLGESGTGKEIFAQAIHQAGRRRQGPFISVNCAALPRELIQSELFGYAEGAFTGARRNGRRGKLEMAHGGTLFLDEIADMPLDMQAVLLRVLEEKSYMPVGGEKVVRPDVRFIAATNRDLEREVEMGRFRRDLYYRLNVVRIQLPPLAERGDDIRLLADYHIKRLAFKLGKPIPKADPKLWPLLAAHNWPGNVRELINVLEQAINFMPGNDLLVEHFPALSGRRPVPAGKPAEAMIPLDVLEKKAIENALQHCRGNISHVAKVLGIGRNTLYRKMKKYSIHHRDVSSTTSTTCF